MKNIFILTIAIVIFYSCSSDTSASGKVTKEDYQNQIDSLESKRAEYFKETGIPPKELVLKSVLAYEFYVADYPEDEKCAKYLFEAAKQYEVDLQDYKNAIRLYKQVYDNYEGFENHPLALFHIGNSYHSMNDTTNAIATFSEFIKKYPEHDFTDDAQGMIDFSRMGEEEFFRRVMEKSKEKSED